MTKKLKTLLIGLFITALGLFGIFHDRDKKPDDYINVEGLLEFAKVWWGPYDSIPNWVRGPSRTRIEITPHLWLKLKNDSALFMLGTAGNKDKQLATTLKQGEHTKIYFHYKKEDGAYPVKQLEQNNKVVFSLQDGKEDDKSIGIGLSIFGVLVIAFGLLFTKRKKNGDNFPFPTGRK